MLQTIEGNFLRWQRSKSGKFNSIQIQTSTIIQSVHVGKDLRVLLHELLTPNVAISLQVKVKKRRTTAKFVVLMPHCSLVVDRKMIPKPIEIKVCSSKHCCKNGSKDICKSLKQMGSDSNIGVRISQVGCMGNCKNAPAIKIDGRQYNKLSSLSAVTLVKKMWCKLQPRPAKKETVLATSSS
jgi:NADH:ubiquinone oxidoreductase subunit E